MSAGPGSRRRRWLIGIVVVLLAGGATFAVLWNRSSARSVSIDEARRRFHGSTTVAPSSAKLVPAAGVYAYTGSGTDSLDKPPKTQAEGPTMPATVTQRADGCWQFRIDYSSNHWQSWDYCAHDGQLDERGGSTYQKWDFVVFANESTTTFACDDSVTVRATQRDGDQWTQTCHDTANPKSISSGTYRYVGTESLDLGGAKVSAMHYRRSRTMSGGQVGTESTDAWFQVGTGLPVRNVRKIEVTTDTVIGQVHYTEDASFEATSVRPTA